MFSPAWLLVAKQALWTAKRHTRAVSGAVRLASKLWQAVATYALTLPALEGTS